jgi:DNA-binding response OmpR family regulator
MATLARILLVSPEAYSAAFLSSALSAEGFGVDAVKENAESLGLAGSGAYDIVLLDLGAPATSSVTFVRSLMKERPEQLVFVVSPDDAESKVRCLELGACDFVAKPFDLTELVVRIRNALRRLISAAPGRNLQVARMTLDVRRRTLDTGDGFPIHLSTREFLLLQHLMLRESDVCTREEILADVWGYGFDPGTNVVDVYIARLRAKLGHGLIETVRNVGYCMNVPGS